MARKLNVGHVLEGSVRRSGDRIRITAQLISASDGYHLWSETYDRKLTDIFAVQDEIAAAVVGALKLKLLHAPGSKERQTAVPEAYNQYLLGREFYLRYNGEDFGRAVQAYRKAVELDPAYAPAWAGLAYSSYRWADQQESVGAMNRMQEEAAAAAGRAVALDPELADGYGARALVVFHQWNWAGALEDLERALGLRPDSPDLLRNYAEVVRRTGRLEEAVESLRKATQIDPLNSFTWSILGSTLVMLGRCDAAREAVDRAQEINPTQSGAGQIAYCSLLQGRPAEALALSQQVWSEVYRLQGAALAHHDLGHPRESQQALDELIARYAHSAAYQIAGVYAWWGENDHAFQWLERARVQRDAGLAAVKVEALHRGLRSDRRWAPLLRSLNLPVD